MSFPSRHLHQGHPVLRTLQVPSTLMPCQPFLLLLRSDLALGWTSLGSTGLFIYTALENPLTRKTY